MKLFLAVSIDDKGEVRVSLPDNGYVIMDGHTAKYPVGEFVGKLIKQTGDTLRNIGDDLIESSKLPGDDGR
jgi:hypothetical protein